MPSGYNNIGEQALVFNTHHLFTVTMTGKVIEVYKRKTLNQFQENGVANVKLPGYLFNRIEHEVSVSVLNIVALAYKRPWFDLRLLGAANVIPIDGNNENVHPGNLLWKYPDKGLKHLLYNELCYIPGFSGYLITNDGRVFNGQTLKEKQAHLSKELYRSISITGEAGNSSRVIPIHRLLGLAYIPYPVNVKDLVINHKNLNRFNDDVGNLEWITQSENITHGKLARNINADDHELMEFSSKYNIDIEFLATALNNTHSTPVESKDLVTGETQKFPSFNAAATALKLHPESIRTSFFRNGRNIVKRRYLFRKENEQWPSLTLEDVRLGHDGQSRAVVCKNIHTGDLKEFVSAAEAIRTLGLSKKRVTKNLKLGRQVITGSYLFQYKDQLKNWVE